MEYLHEVQPARSVRSRSEFHFFFLPCYQACVLIHCILEAPDLLVSTFKLTATLTQSQAPGQDTCAHFNSHDSGLLLSQPRVQANANASINTSSVRMRGASMSAVSTLMDAGSASVSTNTNTGAGGMLAPPSSSTSGGFLAPPPYPRRQWESRTRVHRAPCHAEHQIAREDR